MKLLGVTMPMILVAHVMGAMIDGTKSLPGCAISCWNDSMYVSKCLDNLACLCNESDYQNALFQCVYAQCDISHFGIAVHHTISQCSQIGVNIRLTTMPSGNEAGELKRREHEYAEGLMILGASAGGIPTEPSLPTASNGASFPLQSADGIANGPGDGGGVVPNTKAPVPVASASAESAPEVPPTQTTPSPGTAVTPTRIGPVLFTGAAERVEPQSKSATRGVVFATLAGLYLAA